MKESEYCPHRVTKTECGPTGLVFRTCVDCHTRGDDDDETPQGDSMADLDSIMAKRGFKRASTRVRTYTKDTVPYKPTRAGDWALGLTLLFAVAHFASEVHKASTGTSEVGGWGGLGVLLVVAIAIIIAIRRFWNPRLDTALYGALAYIFLVRALEGWFT